MNLHIYLYELLIFISKSKLMKRNDINGNKTVPVIILIDKLIYESVIHTHTHLYIVFGISTCCYGLNSSLNIIVAMCCSIHKGHSYYLSFYQSIFKTILKILLYA